jgi:hypothetical protein
MLKEYQASRGQTKFCGSNRFLKPGLRGPLSEDGITSKLLFTNIMNPLMLAMDKKLRNK